jgi:hypothetical protein
MHLALRPVLRSVAPNRARHLLLAEAPAFLGFLTLSRPGTFEPIQVSVTGSATQFFEYHGRYPLFLRCAEERIGITGC